MNRYANSKYIKTDDKIRLETPRFVNITEQDIGEYRIITVGKGSRLDNIAYQQYNDASLWWVLAKVNDMIFPFVTEAKNLVVPLNPNLVIQKVTK